MFEEPQNGEYLPGIDSYAAVGGGGGGSTRILVSNAGLGTYSFDTAAEAWSKAGDWTLPFRGGAEYVPEHGLRDGRPTCARSEPQNRIVSHHVQLGTSDFENTLFA